MAELFLPSLIVAFVIVMCTVGDSWSHRQRSRHDRYDTYDPKDYSYYDAYEPTNQRNGPYRSYRPATYRRTTDIQLLHLDEGTWRSRVVPVPDEIRTVLKSHDGETIRFWNIPKAMDVEYFKTGLIFPCSFCVPKEAIKSTRWVVPVYTILLAFDFDFDEYQGQCSPFVSGVYRKYFRGVLLLAK